MTVNLPLSLVNIARTYKGVVEVGGDNRGPMVEQFQKAVDGIAQGEPWCCAYVCFCLARVQEMYGVKHNLITSEHVATMWNLNPMFRSSEPKVGDLACWKKRGTQSGHIGIVTYVSGYAFHTIEGNTSAGDGIERNGDGVFEKPHTMSGGNTFVLLGFLRPFT